MGWVEREWQGAIGAPPWLTVEDVAALSGLTPAEVRREVSERRLPGVTTHPAGGGDWMFRREDVDAWVARR
jgi:excisionase family DNA binding protein